MASRSSKKWFLLITTAGATIALMSAIKPTSDRPGEQPLEVHGPGTPNVGEDLMLAAEGKHPGDEAENLYRKVIAIREQAYGPDHPALIRPLGYLAVSLLERDRLAEAEPVARRCLAIAEKLPRFHADQIGAYLTMVGVALGLGHSDEADKLAGRAIALAEAFPGPDQYNLIETLEPWAGYLSKAGRPADAARLFERLVVLLEAQPGVDEETIAIQLLRLGEERRRQGQMLEAEQSLQRVLGLLEHAPKRWPLTLAGCLTNLSNFCVTPDRFAEREALLRRALSILESSQESDIDLSVCCRVNLALALKNLHKNEEAVAQVEKALAIAEKGLPPESSAMDFALFGSADVLTSLGYFDEALLIGKQSLPLREKLYGPESLEVAQMIAYLIKIECERKNWDEAEVLLTRSVAIREKLALPDDQFLFGETRSLASIHCYRSKFAEAEPLASRATQLAERIFGADSSELANSLIVQGRITQKLGHLDQTESLLTRAFAILEKAPDKEAKTLTECAKLLSWLYLTQHREDDNKALGERLNKIPFVKVETGAVPLIPVVDGEFWAMMANPMATPPVVAPPPPRLIVDGKPAPTMGFATARINPTPKTNDFDVADFLENLGYPEPGRPRATAEVKTPPPAYAIPMTIPEVLPDTLPPDPEVRKTSGDEATKPVVIPTSPK